MKIGLKILLGYGLVALLIIVVGLAGYRATGRVGADFDAAINRSQPVLAALDDLRFHALKLLSATQHHDPAQADETAACRAELDAALARYRELVARYFPGEAEAATVLAQQVADLKQAAQSGGAAAEQALAVLLARVEAAATAEQAELVAYQNGVETEIAEQLRLILAVSVLAFLASLAGGTYIARRLSGPIIALRDATARLGSGCLDTRVEIAGRGEIGELARAFNAMAERLAGDMVSRDYVESIVDSMAEGVIVVDRDGYVERANKAFRNLLRCEPGESLQGWPLAVFFPDPKDLDAVLDSPSRQHWMEIEMRTAGGEDILVALSVAGLQVNNASAGAVLLAQDITERKRNEERLRYLASYDALTGLPNRHLLLDHLRQGLARLEWKKVCTALMFCDLDRFKFVNDTLGHGVGDVLLQRVAERLQACVRPGDVVCRWAGDEFVLLLNDVAKAADLIPIADKIVSQIGAPIQIGPHELYVTVSVGISVAPEHGREAEELVKCADMAMYAAKAQGKNTHSYYAAGMAEHSQERLQLEGALRRALQEGTQLLVHYQAQQRVDGALIGFEALVRWRHPELGLIAPASFLPTAEEAGLMAAIDETVLYAACGQARQWLDQGWPALRVAVNVSDQLFRRGDLPELVARVLAEAGLPPTSLELELTEAIVMADVESSIGTMHRLRALGVDLSIDDFGTGYSSLAHLKRCPIQMLKIDRSFVADVITDANDAAITEAIVALAHKMGIEVLAEGVETEAQLALLRGCGCDAIQGYLLSKPVAAEELPAFVARLSGAPALEVAGAA